MITKERIVKIRIMGKIERLSEMLVDGNHKLEDQIRMRGMIQGLEWVYQILGEDEK